MQLWDIEESDSYTLKGRFQRDRQGHEVWVLSMKKAWLWSEGRWVQEETPAVINDDPIYAGDAGFSAMISDHDFPIYKKNTDILIYGKAKTYAKKPVSSHSCRLLVDEHIDKSLIVIGERQWIDHSGSIAVSAAQPFIEREIDYTNAIGGDERNRLGSGIAESNDELLKTKVPSVFYAGQNWQANSNKVQVAGFGPLPPFSLNEADGQEPLMISGRKNVVLYGPLILMIVFINPPRKISSVKAILLAESG